jgi:hypothetical protein
MKPTAWPRTAWRSVPLKAGAHVIGLAFRHAIAPDESVQTLRNTTDKVPLPTQKPVLLPLDVWVDGARAATFRCPPTA